MYNVLQLQFGSNVNVNLHNTDHHSAMVPSYVQGSLLKYIV